MGDKCNFCGRNSELAELVSDGVGLICCYGGCQYQLHQKKLENDRLTCGVSLEKDFYIRWAKMIEELKVIENKKLSGVQTKYIRGLSSRLVIKPPIPMLLNCPSCSHEHIDEDEWTTKPHKTHQCQTCGHEWRPCNIPTVGVSKL